MERQDKSSSLRQKIENYFLKYELFGCVSAVAGIREILKDNPVLRIEYSWIEEEISVKLSHR